MPKTVRTVLFTVFTPIMLILMVAFIPAVLCIRLSKAAWWAANERVDELERYAQRGKDE